MGEPLSVERLVRLGLTRYEARAYVALVRRDASTPAEVARMAGVPKPRIYDVLQSLVGKGLAANRPGRTAKFLRAAPGTAAARARPGAPRRGRSPRGGGPPPLEGPPWG